MLELEPRVDNLEVMFGRFLMSLEKMSQQVEKMSQQGEKDRERMEQDRERMEQDRERTDRIIAEIRQEMKQDRERADGIIAEIRQQMERDRERTDGIIAEIRQQMERDRKRTDEMIAQMHQRSEQELREFRRESNQKWGELANRLGTVAEDIVAPNLPRIAREQFGCPGEPDDFMVRRWVRHQIDNSKRRDFDVIAVYSDKVLINETKATVRLNYIDNFIEVLADIHGYFPEYRGKTIIPIFAGLSIPENLVRYLTKHKIYALGMGEETMKLLNFESLATAAR